MQWLNKPSVNRSVRNGHLVADMFQSESTRMADVVLPLSGYLETEGHFTNWSGLRQFTKPIGDPLNGMSNTEIIQRLSGCFGESFEYNDFHDLHGELDLQVTQAGIHSTIKTSFPTKDGKAHFTPYATEISHTSASTPSVIEIDSRMATQMERLRA